MKILDEKSGEEIEVYTAEEVQAKVQAKETEFGTIKTGLESELKNAKDALGDRAREFGQFRELHKDVVDKLDVAQRTIYENQKAQHDSQIARETEEKTRIGNQVDAALRAKSGTDEKLFTKMKEMWDVVTIDARTPEEIDRKTLMILGAIGQTEPDLVASIQGFSGGSYIPPKTTSVEPGFGETEAGKGLAKDLGLDFVPPKTK